MSTGQWRYCQHALPSTWVPVPPRGGSLTAGAAGLWLRKPAKCTACCCSQRLAVPLIVAVAEVEADGGEVEGGDVVSGRGGLRRHGEQVLLVVVGRRWTPAVYSPVP